MTHVGKITATIRTGDVSGADTNGRVYLGIGGREFRLNKPGDQFRRNTQDIFIIGDGENIENPDNSNSLPIGGDVNSPRIEFSDLNLYPRYIRFEPQDNGDKWNMAFAIVVAEQYNGNVPSGNSQTFTDLSGNIWLGTRSGQFIGLK
jgi:hypothetical protein